MVPVILVDEKPLSRTVRCSPGSYSLQMVPCYRGCHYSDCSYVSENQHSMGYVGGARGRCTRMASGEFSKLGARSWSMHQVRALCSQSIRRSLEFSYKSSHTVDENSGLVTVAPGLVNTKISSTLVARHIPRPLSYQMKSYGKLDCQTCQVFAKHIAASDADDCYVPELSLGCRTSKTRPEYAVLYKFIAQLTRRQSILYNTW